MIGRLFAEHLPAVLLAAVFLGVLGAAWSLAGMRDAYGSIGSGFLDASYNARYGAHPPESPLERLRDSRRLADARDELQERRDARQQEAQDLDLPLGESRYGSRRGA